MFLRRTSSWSMHQRVEQSTCLFCCLGPSSRAHCAQQWVALPCQLCPRYRLSTMPEDNYDKALEHCVHVCCCRRPYPAGAAGRPRNPAALYKVQVAVAQTVSQSGEDGRPSTTCLVAKGIPMGPAGSVASLGSMIRRSGEHASAWGARGRCTWGKQQGPWGNHM